LPTRKSPSKSTALARRGAQPPASAGDIAAAPGELEDAAAAYAGAARAVNTKRAYTTDFVAFALWCEPQGLAAVPAEPRTIALYLTALAVNEKKVATIERALVSICQAHELNGLPSPRKAPEVAEALQGIRRTIGVAPNQKEPVLVDTLRALIEPMRKEQSGRCPRSSPALPRLRKQLPPLRARCARRSGSFLRRRRARDRHPARQDRSGRTRAHGGHPLRWSAADLPGSGGTRLARPRDVSEGPLFRPINVTVPQSTWL
jgi:hypothetical protein